jgi:hypothetical protein
MTLQLNSPRNQVAALAGFLILVVAGEAAAQPRSEQPAPKFEALLPVTDTEAIGAWLKRLVGRFEWEGSICCGPDGPERVKGSSDCISIGEGPGVQCILNVTWVDQYALNPKLNEDNVMISYLDPAMELFGLDPLNSAISHLVVNNKGMPEGGLGFVKGNTATFKTPCVNAQAGCYRVVVIEARPDSKVMWVWFGKVDHPASGIFDFYATMTLRSMPPDWEGAPARTTK